MRGLLLDVCCAPDALGALEAIGREFREVVLYWGNSNIYPREEWETRLLDARRLARARGLRLVVGRWRHEEWRDWVRGTENTPEGGARCALCFRFRLRELAERAKELGLRAISTSLLVSPHKDAALINLLGEVEARRAGLTWVGREMRAFFGPSVRMSREMNMYRQDYCGCEFSRRPEEWGLARGAPLGSPAQRLLAKRLQVLLEERGEAVRWLERRGPVWIPLGGRLEGFPLLPLPGTPTTRLRERPVREGNHYRMGDFRVYLGWAGVPVGPGGVVPEGARELLESGRRLRVSVEATWREARFFCIEVRGKLLCPHDPYRVPEPEEFLGRVL